MVERGRPTVSHYRYRTEYGMVLTLFIAATVLGMASAGDNVLGWDLRFAGWIQQWDGNVGTALYNIGDMLGTTSLAAIVTVIALIIATVKKQWRVSIFLILVLVLRLAGTQLKPLFDSPRPTADQLRLLHSFDGTGYPSGHSMTVAMMSTMLILIVWNVSEERRLRWVTALLAITAVLLVGWSRVWSGAHWPSDVLGGWIYGIALTLLAWVLSALLVSVLVFRRDAAPENATSQRESVQSR